MKEISKSLLKAISLLTSSTFEEELIAIKRRFSENISDEENYAQHEALRCIFELNQQYGLNLDINRILDSMLELIADQNNPHPPPLLSFRRVPSDTPQKAERKLPVSKRDNAELIRLKATRNKWPFDSEFRTIDRLPETLGNLAPPKRVSKGTHYIAYLPGESITDIFSPWKPNAYSCNGMFMTSYTNMSPTPIKNFTAKDEYKDLILEVSGNKNVAENERIGKSAYPVYARITKGKTIHEWINGKKQSNRSAFCIIYKDRGAKKAYRDWYVKWKKSFNPLKEYQLDVIWQVEELSECFDSGEALDSDFLITYADAQLVWEAFNGPSEYMQGLIPLSQVIELRQNSISKESLHEASVSFDSQKMEEARANKEAFFVRIPEQPPIRKLNILWRKYTLLNRIFYRSSFKGSEFCFNPKSKKDGKIIGTLYSYIDEIKREHENVLLGIFYSIMRSKSPRDTYNKLFPKKEDSQQQ